MSVQELFEHAHLIRDLPAAQILDAMESAFRFFWDNMTETQRLRYLEDRYGYLDNWARAVARSGPL